MRATLSALMVALLTCLSVTGIAQNKKGAQKKNSTTAETDSAKWRADYYIENRDSAYSDPRVGLKKLMGGNRRFTEGKSLRPRQDSLALHGTESGQKPFAIIVGCSDSRVPNEIIFDQGVRRFIYRPHRRTGNGTSILRQY